MARALCRDGDVDRLAGFELLELLLQRVDPTASLVDLSVFIREIVLTDGRTGRQN